MNSHSQHVTRRVVVFCTTCGNRSMRHAHTGEDVEVVLLLRDRDVVRLREEM